MGIPILSEKASIDFESSKIITAPLVAIIITQEDQIPKREEIKQIRNERTKQVNEIKKLQQIQISDQLEEKQQRCLKQSSEKGASSWLSVLPLKDHGFTLNKEEFQDAIALRYDWHIKNLPVLCPCGKDFDVNHAMNCKKGGFINIRHNNVRDFEANLLKKVCADVEIEPKLHPVNNDEARLDVRARGFWRAGQSAFFDIRMTNTNTPSQVKTPVESIYKKHKNEKKRTYNDRVLNNKHANGQSIY